MAHQPLRCGQICLRHGVGQEQLLAKAIAVLLCLTGRVDLLQQAEQGTVYRLQNVDEIAAGCAAIGQIVDRVERAVRMAAAHQLDGE